MFRQAELKLHSIAQTANVDIVTNRDGRVEQKRRTRRHILDEWLLDGGRMSGRIQNPFQKSEPSNKRFGEGETGLAEGTVPTNDDIVEQGNHVNPATRLGRFLDRRPHDEGIAVNDDDDIDSGMLPENDRMSAGPEANATDVNERDFSEDERVEYGSAPDGHFVGHEQDTKQVASKSSKRVEMRYDMNEPSTQEGMKDIEMNERENQDNWLFGTSRSNIANDDIATRDQRAGNNGPGAVALSADIKNLFPNNPRGAYAMQYWKHLVFFSNAMRFCNTRSGSQLYK